MSWFILFVGVVVVCLVAALILGLAGGSSVGGLGGETRSLSHEPLPDDAVVDSDFDDLMFDVGLRGYRMSQVDGVVDRLRRELREKDEEIAVLRAGVPDPGAPARDAPDPGAAVNRKSTPSAASEAPEAPDGAEPAS